MHMATCKNVLLGAPGKISSPHFLFWDHLYISETSGARKLKFGVLLSLYKDSMQKKCPLGGVWGDHQLPIFIFGPPVYLRN